MNPPSPPTEIQEVQLQEAELENLNDISLPAEQVIAEQCKDAGDALPRLAPRYIP